MLWPGTARGRVCCDAKPAFKVLSRHLTAGQIDKVKEALSEEVRAIWSTNSARGTRPATRRRLRPCRRDRKAQRIRPGETFCTMRALASQAYRDH